MAKRRVMFTFPTELIQEPIIYNLGRRFDVVTNVRRADVSEDKGWVVLELEGGGRRYRTGNRLGGVQRGQGGPGHWGCSGGLKAGSAEAGIQEDGDRLPL
ncbi:NIL domain-containing protein [Dehalococcoidia bacterium]|nr:NIL domain-containing protein [Dehalococcoidia bacterium]